MQTDKQQIDKIITELYTCSRFNKIITSYTRGDMYTEDLKSELILILYGLKEGALIKAYEEGYVYYLIANIVRKQYRSNSSPFYYKYKKKATLEFLPNYDYKTVEDEVEEIKDNSKLILGTLAAIEELTYVDKEIFKMYFKLGDYNMVNGLKRDKKCIKDTYSHRKIAKSLHITNKYGDVGVSVYYSHRSVNRSLDLIRAKLG